MIQRPKKHQQPWYQPSPPEGLLKIISSNVDILPSVLLLDTNVGLFQYKDHLFRHGLPMIKIDSLIFIMGIPMLVRGHLYIETARRLSTNYSDVIMGAMASQITNLTRPVNSPHKRPVTRKMFPFDDVILRYPTDIIKPKDVRPSADIVLTTTSYMIFHRITDH